ncbi:(2Fe-2S)-binding protein [Motilimonas eburnea]|uniref:(2Fe-2S)-binding protein n=1 Tax=Motilimonas eburnea TaxID=1737488 RepID=UPI001E63BE85|nr:(2Fe-2S)-binding protein [Motilimonas eburnea]
MYICICKGITDKTIRQAVADGKTFKMLKRELGLATQCGTCIEAAVTEYQQALLAEQVAASVRPHEVIAVQQVA